MIINNKFKIDTVINKGAFGTVAKGIKIKDNKPIVIKFDTTDVNILKHETFILNYLHSKKIKFIPYVIYYGLYKNNPFLVIPLYDCNLNQLVNNNTLSNVQSLRIIYKLLLILKDIHSNYVIHRDLKPENIMVHNNDIYIIDFGLSTFYFNDDGEHIENTKIKSIVGSLKFSSIFVNQLNTPSRRDDIISIFYILLLLLFKDLPWSQINQDDYLKRKSLLYIIELSKFHEYDTFLNNIFNYLYKLDFDEKPLYEFILNSFDNLIN
tara:strand:+ start:501 stop:1295 length:795 start_codon:yes stop_codon:yes gene_type:complete